MAIIKKRPYSREVFVPSNWYNVIICYLLPNGLAQGPGGAAGQADKQAGQPEHSSVFTTFLMTVLYCTHTNIVKETKNFEEDETN